MSLCINFNCQRAIKKINQENNLFCNDCGSKLTIHKDYRATQYLGGGGFGTTYLVSNGGKAKVLKVLHNTSSKAVSLFNQEAHVLRKLNHVGIPKIEEEGRFDYYPRNSTIPIPCFIMEYIEGETLDVYLERQSYRPISEEVAFRWLEELLQILDLVHSASYLHRDIKPANIIIRKNGKLALIDFGTAREETQTFLQKQQGQALTGVVSIGYTPHEQANGQADFRSDFFSLGRTFVFLLTGKTPDQFQDSLKNGLLWQKYAQGYSKKLKDFLDLMMQPDVDDRPKSTRELLSILSNISYDISSNDYQSYRNSNYNELPENTQEKSITFQASNTIDKWQNQKLIVSLILALILPPLAVCYKNGFKIEFWINLLLTIFGFYILGLVHAIWVIARKS